MKIMPNRMDLGFYKYQDEFEKKALEVLRSGWYVLGKEVDSFEREFAYMIVHGFYHLMGYDHIKEDDKKKRLPQSNLLSKWVVMDSNHRS